MERSKEKSWIYDGIFLAPIFGWNKSLRYVIWPKKQAWLTLGRIGNPSRMERYSWKRNPKRIFEQNITLQSVTQNSNSDFWVALNTLDFSKQIWVHICVKDCILFSSIKSKQKLPSFWKICLIFTYLIRKKYYYESPPRWFKCHFGSLKQWTVSCWKQRTGLVVQPVQL